jgi:hypothetical protein
MHTMPRFALLVLALGLLPAPLRAQDLPQLSLRELTIRATAVVLAEPAEPTRLERFKVIRALRGGVKEGEVLAPNLSRYFVRRFDDPVPPRRRPQPRRFARALFFLAAGTSSPGPRKLVPSGVRFCTDDGRVLAPIPGRSTDLIHNLKDYTIALYDVDVRPRHDWNTILAYVRADVAVVQHVAALRRLARPERRVRALLNWAERHRHEFDTPRLTRSGSEPRVGWAELHRQVFACVLQAGRPQECWEAIELYTELNRGALPPLPVPCFGSPAGRDFLLGIAADESALLGRRLRALELLGSAQTLWPASRGVSLTAAEQERFLDRLAPLLAVKVPGLRAAGARVVRHLSVPPAGRLPSKRALAALVSAYKEEPTGPVRDELAEAVCAVGGPAHWQELRGNPSGLLVRLRDLERQGGEVHFWLSMTPCGQAVRERPTLLLERLGLLGIPAQTKRLPLPVSNLPRPWHEGWDGREYLLVQLPLKDLAPGTWRLTVEGTAGKDRKKWTSEPRTFDIPKPPAAPGRPRATRFRVFP